MNDDLRDRIIAFFEQQVQGGTAQNDVQGLIEDEAVEADVLTYEEYQANEIAIHALIDERWFTCEGCGWTLPMEEMAEDGDGWRCKDCNDE